LKKKLVIYSNLKNCNFFKQILPEHTLIFKPLSQLSENRSNDDGGIILDTLNVLKINFNSLQKNYLLISNNKKLYKLKKNIKVIQPPIFPHQLKNNIEIFLNNNLLEVGDLSIFNQKMQNIKNKKKCSLTEIENKILIFLINNKTCTKEQIKEKILNIKSSIETNSVDTHLTRIRKKFYKVETQLKIKTKNSKISIIFNSNDSG